MSFLKRVEAANVGPIKAWREIDDLLLGDTTPYWDGGGVLGSGTYLRPKRPLLKGEDWNIDDDDEYDDLPSYWYIITEYEIRFKNLVTLDKTNTKDLWSNYFVGSEDNPLFKGKIQNEDISDLAIKKRYDGVLVVNGNVDGGDQILIPSGVKPPSKTIKHHVIFRERDLAREVAAYIGTKAKKITDGYLVEVSTSQESKADVILAKHKT